MLVHHLSMWIKQYHAWKHAQDCACHAVGHFMDKHNCHVEYLVQINGVQIRVFLEERFPETLDVDQNISSESLGSEW